MTLHSNQSGDLQLSLVYTEAKAEGLGLRPGESTVALITSFTVTPGTDLRLALSDRPMPDRTVLNDGTAAQRTVLPATMLRLEDQ